MDYKDIWIEIYGDLEEELGREPTSSEIEDEFESLCDSIRGCYED